MKSKKLCASILAILLNSCSFESIYPQNNSKVDINNKTKSFGTLNENEIKAVTDSGIVTANNKFGVNLFLDIVKEQKNENIFISPASLSLALQMTYNGADKETKDEMAKVLEISSLPLEDVNNLNKLLIKKLNNPAPDIQLKVANSLWGGKARINFKDEFKSSLTNYYSANSQELDFSDSKSADIINQWASDNTNGKITKVIDEIPSDIIAYLMNAIYFKANWTTKFKEENTLKDSDFNLSDGKKKKHPLMSDFRDFRYINYNYDIDTESKILPENQFEGAELTYGEDSKVSLFLFLPNEKSSLEKFYTQLNNENIEKWVKKFYHTQGMISFPKFKLKYTKQLKENLKSLGMVSAFNSANFTKMGTSPLGNIFISYVSHDTFVDVNEEGTEATAITTVGTSAQSVSTTSRFVANRPFFYLIRDNETKSILFMGAVNNPEYN
ncbi:MAG: serpin family protein [Candidatus Sericytochromatia bacterium]